MRPRTPPAGSDSGFLTGTDVAGDSSGREAAMSCLFSRSSNGFSGSRRTIPTLALALAVTVGGIVVGSPGGATGDTPPLKLPPPLVLDKEADSPGKVVFRHTTHVPLENNKCLACHPRPFSILHATLRVKHDDMNAGRSCGICHDGKKAFPVDDSDSCARCHGGESAQP
jgi:c(7)-type cytochrome triheme protein